MGRGGRGTGAALLAAAALLLAALPGAADVAEYQLKAACLYNFAKFVTWPPQAFASGNAPLVIGVVGEDPFGKTLEEAVAGKSVDGHALKVNRFDSFTPAEGAGLRKCHILFICYSEKDKVGDILGTLRGANVLTVSEIENFLLKGGGLLFDMEGKKVALQINVEAAKKSGLEISSRLLQVCKLYKSE